MAHHRAWRHPLPLLIAVAAIAATPVAAGSAKPNAAPEPKPIRAEGRMAAASASSPPSLLSGPLPSLKVATLELPQPPGALPENADSAAPILIPGDSPARADGEAEEPLVFGPPPLADGESQVAALTSAEADADAGFGALPTYVLTETADGATPAEPAQAQAEAASHHHPLPYAEVALDILLDIPLLVGNASSIADGASFGPDLGAVREPAPASAAVEPGEATDPDAAETEAAALVPDAPDPEARQALTALHHDPVAVFGRDPNLFPALAFEYQALAKEGIVPVPALKPEGQPVLAALDMAPDAGREERDGIWPSPAERLELTGPKLARARKCLAEAIYFESRGEPKRGQVAVAQVIVNRVFSGYYPADVCGTVYQNAHRHLACQFTFACDNVKDVIREPDMWVQAKEIAADMLDGKLWLDTVGRATHYHAYWVHPSWVKEMRKLDKIGVHTFYRPRRWGDG